MTDTCFRMKGTTLTSIVLEVIDFEPDTFESQLAEKVNSAPQFFTRSSLILHLVKSLSATEFELLVALCRRFKLQPMAVRGEVGPLRSIINDLGLADVSQSKFTESSLKTTKSESTTSKEQAANEPAASTPVSPPVPTPAAVTKPVKVISRPVRSGQQVYAEGGDLVITAAVSEGAEVLADGNIHVYGTLRGRALAGVKGNVHARVFCQSLDAELISIAGQFIMHETVKASCWKQPAQIYLEEDTLHIEPIA
ncbi:septum site-determining protein MinC [Alteromonas sp. KS69]|jgi:septum site-determining protein MinC|uniref:septum site-determining protein MinC n=1 Tax=unclassified Alteromonas TaxID=2614992 RepID=UPI000C4745A8|nr:MULTISPECIES: septum site-determining protein MinC [unclassified Alteromonas]MBB66379.1 septum site-determining protein MinC [Rickettsiales bacterium]MBO7923129.1 septum site-determining protein MinC [Alteromonas sp. K632G]RUP78972.1 septum site-determining protein MinC [Alteromonas sp. KS69]